MAGDLSGGIKFAFWFLGLSGVVIGAGAASIIWWLAS